MINKLRSWWFGKATDSKLLSELDFILFVGISTFLFVWLVLTLIHRIGQ